MSAVAVHKELRSAIERGDVEAVDGALRDGLSPNFEFTENIFGVTAKFSLLCLAAKVCTL